MITIKLTEDENDDEDDWSKPVRATRTAYTLVISIYQLIILKQSLEISLD